MSTAIDFPESTADLPQNETKQNSDRPRGAWEVTVTDVYKSPVDSKFAEGGTRNGLWIDIMTKKNGKARQVFYPDPPSEKTRNLLQKLEELGIAPHEIGGWENLRGYVLMWTNEERSFKKTTNGVEETITYTLEFPCEVVRAPQRDTTRTARASESEKQSPFDQLKAMGVGKSKSELKFAIAKTPALSEFSEGVASGTLINDLVEDGVWALEGGKIVKGENF